VAAGPARALVRRRMAGLEQRADFDRELIVALAAATQADAAALYWRDPIKTAAMRADRSVSA
jgi:hypothetical protein